MQAPPWMPRTEEEYRQQVAQDAGPQPDEMVRLQQALDATEEEVARLQMVRDAAEREIKRLRAALEVAVGRFGYLSTVLSLGNKNDHAKGALEWSEEIRAVLGE